MRTVYGLTFRAAVVIGLMVLLADAGFAVTCSKEHRDIWYPISDVIRAKNFGIISLK